MKLRRRLRRFALVGLFVVAALGLALGGLRSALSTSMPAFDPATANDDDAERLSAQVAAALNASAWEQTRALRWRREGYAVPVLWDRDRDFVEVLTDEDTRVLLDRRRDRVIALRNGERLDGESLERARALAEKWFINEAFWLMAPLKLHDVGAVRHAVKLDGADALLVRYPIGGVTPGDAYLWELDDDGRPKAWRMWTQIIPVPGVRVAWTDWRQLRTGAWVAWKREASIGALRFERIEGVRSLGDLFPDSDPFAPLLAIPN